MGRPRTNSESFTPATVPDSPEVSILKKNNRDLQKAIANCGGDELCWMDLVPQPVQIPPAAEFLESCRRYHAQISSRVGEVEGARTIAQLEARVAELESLFDLQHTRDQEAVAMWRAATGKHDVLPDLGDLLGWLMGEIRRLMDENEKARSQSNGAALADKGRRKGSVGHTPQATYRGIGKMIRDARFNEDRSKRWELIRDWTDELHGQPVRTANFIMLNPSKADAKRDDMTVTKSIGFCRRWGYNRLVVTNLDAHVSTDPWQLPNWSGIDMDNRTTIQQHMAQADIVIAAWGQVPLHVSRKICVPELIYLVKIACPVPLWCIGKTAKGHPLHPSRTAYTEAPVLWCEAAE